MPNQQSPFADTSDLMDPVALVSLDYGVVPRHRFTPPWSAEFGSVMLDARARASMGAPLVAGTHHTGRAIPVPARAAKGICSLVRSVLGALPGRTEHVSQPVPR